MLLVQCGTRSGYRKHLRLQETPCVECKKANTEYSKQWQANHPEQDKQHRRKYEKNNKEKISAYQKDWYKLNKEKVLEHSKEYYENNKQKSFIKARKRKLKLKDLQTEPYTVAQILEMYGTVCHICNDEIDLQAPRSTGQPGWEKGLHLDHVIPISKGGTDTMDNVKPSHAICNISKGATILVDIIC